MPPDPYMAELAERFREQGLHPAPLPVGLDFRPGGRCIRCGTCDAFPCRVLAKGDADVCAVRPALDSPDVEIWTDAFVSRISTDPSGARVTGVDRRAGWGTGRASRRTSWSSPAAR